MLTGRKAPTTFDLEQIFTCRTWIITSQNFQVVQVLLPESSDSVTTQQGLAEAQMEQMTTIPTHRGFWECRKLLEKSSNSMKTVILQGQSC